MKKDKQKTGVIYTRLGAKEKEAFGLSLENQIEICQAWAELNDVKVLDIFLDEEGFIQKEKIDKKPFYEAFSRAKREKVNYFIVSEISRFTRPSTTQSVIYKSLLEESHINLISVLK